MLLLREWLWNIHVRRHSINYKFKKAFILNFLFSIFIKDNTPFSVFIFPTTYHKLFQCVYQSLIYCQYLLQEVSQICYIHVVTIFAYTFWSVLIKTWHLIALACIWLSLNHLKIASETFPSAVITDSRAPIAPWPSKNHTCLKKLW